MTEINKETDLEVRLKPMIWLDLHNIAERAVASLTKEQLHDKLIEIFPLENGQEYVGSLPNHFRGKLKYGGIESLVAQLDSNSLRRLIIGLNKI